jgi:HAD superfamily hydrolase (TIGR01459 family)
MSKNIDKEGLRSIAEDYDLFFIDIWGVIHNGIKLHKNAIDTLLKIEKVKKNYVLLTNAPRPNNTVKIFLDKMGLDKNIQKKVYTSGEAALNYLKKNHQEEIFYHIGPGRDFDLFIDFKENKTNNLKECSYFLCTGLFDNYDKDLNFYKDLLSDHVSKKMICTNPDLIVDRGNIRELCAGSVAMIFEKMGGEVIYFGKPFPEVYNQSVEINNKRILCIGDNLNTDIKGANLQNFHSLLISDGIHRQEIIDHGLEVVSKKHEVVVNFEQSELKW